MSARLNQERWTRAVGSLIEAIGRDTFPAALGETLRLISPFGSMIVTAFSGTSRPRTLFHDLDEVQAVVNTAYYDSGPYLLDPFYLACRNDLAPGPYLLMDLAPPGFLHSEYYDAFYRRIRLVDELGLIIRVEPERHVLVSLARGVKQAKFAAADLAAQRTVFPIVSAAVLKHWGEATATVAGTGDLVRRLKSFGAQSLSPREAEVVHLILDGRSTRSIATLLGSTEGTVKVHRRHAYAKLGITSQAELFALATRFLQGPG